MPFSSSAPDVADFLLLSPQKNLADGHILLIDKPLAWTSFDVVGKVRYLLRHRLGYGKLKVGHAGTLDPLATGLVVVCIGKATKFAGELTNEDKRYVASFTLGARTPSHDLETPVARGEDFEHFSEEDIRRAMRSMEGEVMQVPPLFSAKRVEGKRAYALARLGEEISLPPVPVAIHRFQLLSYDPLNGVAVADILCSKGTYIRSIARDLGEKLGCGAYLSALRRTASGRFTLDDAVSITDFEGWVELVAG